MVRSQAAGAHREVQWDVASGGSALRGGSVDFAEVLMERGAPAVASGSSWHGADDDDHDSQQFQM